MKFNLKAIICLLKDSHDISECDEDTLYNIKEMPECGVTIKCKRCRQELSVTIDKEDPEYYGISESE